jgi:hypothetical protein
MSRSRFLYFPAHPGQAFVIKFDQVLNPNFRPIEIDEDKETPAPNLPPPPAGGRLAGAPTAVCFRCPPLTPDR